jgi:hypothetical protein
VRLTFRPSGRALITAAILVAVVVAGPLLDAAGQSYWLIALTRALLLAVLAVAGVGALKHAVLRARYLTKDPRAIGSASRRELEAYLRDQGVPIRASATLADLRRSVHEQLGLDGGKFTDAAGRARFGPPNEARRSARAARREVSALLRRARGELSARARLRGFVSLRSLRGWQG